MEKIKRKCPSLIVRFDRVTTAEKKVSIKLDNNLSILLFWYLIFSSPLASRRRSLNFQQKRQQDNRKQKEEGIERWWRLCVCVCVCASLPFCPVGQYLLMSAQLVGRLCAHLPTSIFPPLVKLTYSAIRLISTARHSIYTRLHTLHDRIISVEKKSNTKRLSLEQNRLGKRQHITVSVHDERHFE